MTLLITGFVMTYIVGLGTISFYREEKVIEYKAERVKKPNHDPFL